ncbi:MAG: hypothetical protein ACXAEN_19130 [Candidatus Thorarchaeota archaeon]|jgi:hypothetical protein
MAEGDTTFMNHAKELTLLGDVEYDAHNFRIILMGSGYTPSVDGNNGYADISAQEIVTSGYTATGILLTALTVTQDDTNDRAKWDAADVTWTSLGTTTINDAVIYNDTITAAPADPLICSIEITTNSNGNDYTIAFNTNGIAYLA